ncbi:SPOR domain-containing protein, partial [candidate division KSB1 bacterium]|nr:SPOR domain-containing protein [candidate division KSB1 bacterium]
QYVLEKPEVARRYFAYLYHTYPQSKWADDAQYLTAQCYIVEGKLDSANRLLKQFVRVHPRSLFADLAVADLESDIWDTEEPADPMPDKPVMPKPTTGKAYWAIQVGAFTVRENATNILKGLQEVGYHGEIVQKRVGNRLFHAVWIGQFKDRASAEAYAQRFVVKLTKEYQIVKKP